MEQFTWEILATIAGCGAGTALLVQLFKQYIPIPTQLFSYIVAVIIFNVSAYFLGVWSWALFGIAFLNAGVVSLASNGAFEAAKRVGEGIKTFFGANKSSDEA